MAQNFVMVHLPLLMMGNQTLVDMARRESPEIFMNSEELARRDGYSLKTHTVQTSDGYLLDLHRIPGSGAPVFLQHGFQCASHFWLLAGPNRSLAYLLADQGYDVWMGNSRGNRYASRHVNLTTDDEEFWNFSWHEMGLYDLSAEIDYVLNKTGHSQLVYIAHSMGNNMLCVLLSMRPEYNSKIRLYVALAPAVFMGNSRAAIVRLAAPFNQAIMFGTKVAHVYVFNPRSDQRYALQYFFCKEDSPTAPECQAVYYSTFGYSDGLNKTKLAFAITHNSEGASMKTAVHFLQLHKSDKFQQFDYDLKNKQIYGSWKPPLYNLSLVTPQTVVVYSDGDNYVASEDALRLAKTINATIYRVPTKHFNHMDIGNNIHVKELLYDYLLSVLNTK